jgi:hypothetical protein
VVRVKGATMSFIPGADQGSPIVRNEYRTRSGRSWSSWASLGLRQSVTVRPCPARSEVQFQVRSVNAVGIGPSSRAASRCPG